MTKSYNKNKNALVPWFLMASYAYYVMGTSIMSDKEFDNLASKLQKNWSTIKHPHKHLITKEMLAATTGFTLDYPSIVKYSAIEYLNSLSKNQLLKYSKKL